MQKVSVHYGLLDFFGGKGHWCGGKEEGGSEEHHHPLVSDTPVLALCEYREAIGILALFNSSTVACSGNAVRSCALRPPQAHPEGFATLSLAVPYTAQLGVHHHHSWVNFFCVRTSFCNYPSRDSMVFGRV